MTNWFIILFSDLLPDAGNSAPHEMFTICGHTIIYWKLASYF